MAKHKQRQRSDKRKNRGSENGYEGKEPRRMNAGGNGCVEVKRSKERAEETNKPIQLSLA